MRILNVKNMVGAVDAVKAAVAASEPTKVAASLTAASAEAPAKAPAVRLAKTSLVFTAAKAWVAQPATPTLAVVVVGRLQTRQEYYC
jgi:hypothetical protein